MSLSFKELMLAVGAHKQEKFEKNWPKILKKLNKEYPEIKNIIPQLYAYEQAGIKVSLWLNLL